MVNNKNNLDIMNSNLSQNFKFLGNQNLLGTNRIKFVFNYISQDYNLMLIYKDCCNKKRLNVTNSLKFISENRRLKWK